MLLSSSNENDQCSVEILYEIHFESFIEDVIDKLFDCFETISTGCVTCVTELHIQNMSWRALQDFTHYFENSV